VHSQRECTLATLQVGEGSAATDPLTRELFVEAVLTRLLDCGSVILAPGVLPKLTVPVLKEMAEFGQALLIEGGTVGWGAADLMPPPHSDKRGDAWPPFTASAPFGRRLLEALADLGPLLHPLLGEDSSLDFVSMLYAKAGAQSQGWHGEGRDPELSKTYGLTNKILKVQVVLHKLEPAIGMIHFLGHNASGLYEQHTPFKVHNTHPPTQPPGKLRSLTVDFLCPN
jgi:hypothetical protein